MGPGADPWRCGRLGLCFGLRGGLWGMAGPWVCSASVNDWGSNSGGRGTRVDSVAAESPPFGPALCLACTELCRALGTGTAPLVYFLQNPKVPL